MKKYLLKLLLFTGAGWLLVPQSVTAQLSVTGQLRTRTEMRHGQGTLPAPDAKASVFTSQRTRLNLGYGADRYRFFVSAQEVRVWGSDQSTISNLEGGKFFLHQAWAEMILSDSATIKVDNLSVKAGRQEIMYDDSRLLGNLDWLQQARRHDALVMKFSHKGWIADAGFAFNQNAGKDTPGKSGNMYNGIPASPVVPGSNGIGMMYKAMQYGYFARTGKFGKANVLVFKDDFQKMRTVENVLLPTAGVNSRVTVGGAVFSKLSENLQLNGAAYYQGGRDRFGNPLDAHNFTLDAALTSGKFQVNPGFDYLSGNNTTRESRMNRRFDPLYGTPHKFWGFMDYFYVADPFGVDGNQTRSPGLADLFIRSKYKAHKNLNISLDLHEFYAANEIAFSETTGITPDGRRLGAELDLVINYSPAREVTIEAGYATIFATDNLNLLKAPAAIKQNHGQWAYLILNFTPDLLARTAKKK